MSETWDKRYIELARLVSTWSKDPSTQVGACAVGDKGQILSMGYNGFPRGISDTQDRLNNREIKYELTSHAEMNVIYNASFEGVSLRGSTLYVWGLPVCSECAKGIIQVGISSVKIPIYKNIPEKWSKSFEKSYALFKEAGVNVEFIDVEY